MQREEFNYFKQTETTFKKIASLVRVMDIATPFAFDVAPETKHKEIIDRLRGMRRLGDPVLVDSLERIHGIYFTPYVVTDEDLEEHGYPELSFPEQDECFSTDQIVSGDMPVLDAIELFATGSYPYYVVLHGRRYIGVLRFQDLMKPAARICLFSLTLELEFAAMDLCGRFADKCIEALPQSRLKKATEQFEKRISERVDLAKYIGGGVHRFGKEGMMQRIIDCSQFADKATMLMKCRLTAESSSKIKDVFGRAEKLRNTCAHPSIGDDEALGDPKALWQLIHDCHDLIDTFRRVTARPTDSV